MTNPKKIAAALALACATLTTQAAHAADISNPVDNVAIVDGAAAFGRLITGNHSGDTFTDTYAFDVAAASSFVADLYAHSGNPKNGLDITGFALYAANGALVSAGQQLSTGRVDHWTLALDNIDAGSGYYVAVTGSVLSQAAGTYSGVVATVSAVPEPATYGMLLGGMALLGVAARRRKTL